ncbi:MAG TPA: glycosyltransferase family A protein [Allocoleopsis sp.]
MKPLVSVIIPVYNGAKFLKDAIANVKSQNYHPLEIIIVDDGSTDETAIIAQSFGEQIIYIYQENKKAASARNKGLKIAKGELMAFLDVDDLWSENKLNQQVKYLETNTDIEVVTGLLQRVVIDENKQILEEFDEKSLTVSCSTALYRKYVFEKVGYFDEVLKQNEDTDLFMRLRENNIKIGIIEEILLYYRRHKTNTTLNQDENMRFMLKSLQKSIQRRRNYEAK